MKTFAALLCLVAYCTAQKTTVVPPTPCKSPEQWESGMYRSDRSKEFVEVSKVSYDESNKRIRIIEEVQVGSAKDYYDTLLLHNIGKEYKLNLKTRQCNVTSLSTHFRGFHVPPYAKFIFEGSIGATGVPGEYFVAETWEGEYEDNSRFVVTVTKPDCVPINFGFYSNETGFIQSDFFDLSLGISVPTVFIPPRECTM